MLRFHASALSESWLIRHAFIYIYIYIYMIKIFLCVLGTTHGFGCEVEVGESIQLEEECVHKLLNFHMRWVLLLLSLLLN